MVVDRGFFSWCSVISPIDFEERHAIEIGLLGIGKIARDQHIPALMASRDFDLVACASRNARVRWRREFHGTETMLAEMPQLDCVSICTPPQAHFAAALTALRAGKHVMARTTDRATGRCAAGDEAADMAARCSSPGHSRFAASVDARREWVHARTLTGGRIVWKEDVHHWHPGQQWIWRRVASASSTPASCALGVDRGACRTRSASRSPCWRSPRISRRLSPPMCACAPRVASRWRPSSTFGKGRAELGYRTVHHHRPLKLSQGGATLEIAARSSRPIEAWRGSTTPLLTLLRRCARRPGPKWTGGRFNSLPTLS